MFFKRPLVEFGRAATKEDATAPRAKATNPPRRKLSRCLFLFGVVSVSYLLGAAVMFFELPSSDFLNKAFLGGKAWYERRQASARPPGQKPPPATIGKIDVPGKTFDGFTLYTLIPGSRAFLINMRGEVVYEWAVSFSQVWPKPSHVRVADDALVAFFGCHLYANGDLLIVFQGMGNPFYGYGLAKLDKDSNMVWKYSANVHHDVDVGEDGTIYAIKQELVDEVPAGLESIPTPCLVDSLVVLSPDGVELKKIPLLEAFQNSPYSPLLSMLERPPELHRDDARRRDVFHTNFVKVLTRLLAPKFPLFKAGQVLISMRHLDTIAVVDAESRAVVWAARGPWRAQHDPQFLDNGRLLIFDNLGSPKMSRVLEYDPHTQAFPWSYSGENGAPFLTVERGMSQRLPNGNTLIVNSQKGEMLEVTRDKEVVWSCLCHYFLSSARRFSAGQLHFLKGGQRARP